ncbi:hypothetical protein OA92_14415 [Marinomonas sp. SBI22]|uniref:hypothetical protein n=1 Tax=unclassified Marinomonas TaxID=196814 RepID=UPI0007AF5F09|nr:MULTISPECIES: hypothetical protein [unclassified Marinomonas]KZM41579.1 hypothetical protein OA92_14415 [Marinomonas sp. SBI22]KZM43415.1 hypothetical protein OA91_12620 [Marinomonas sp. SBI8L]
MQSENLSLTREKDVAASQSFEELSGKDKKDNQTNDLESKIKVKTARKTTKVKVAKRLCIFE